MKFYDLKMCTFCITMMCQFSIDSISIANEAIPTATDPLNPENKAHNSHSASWLDQTKEECQLGNFDACNKLGAKYESLGNAQLIWLYYEKACTGLHAESCATLGYMLTHGNHIILDQQAGRYYYGKACDLGNKLSCESIGWNSNENITCVKDENPEKCRALACEKSDAGHTCLVIGINYYDGSHSSGKDDTKAATYYNKACRRKNGNGCLNLGDLFRDGIGVPKNESEALRHYIKGCLYDSEYACNSVRKWAEENTIFGEKIPVK